MGDQGFDQRFGLGVAAAGDDVGDVIGDPVQGSGAGCGGGVGQCLGEFVAAGHELCCLGAQFGEAGADEFGSEGAGFEGGEVAVD
ncbi:hypothetical protein [Nocardia acidivorans]|uniref:hypothetical protein n=1 Tax=Nocardia acidivorans TaxID=404580 RepID=UPI001C3FD7C3|nr:hypothetical protein [Nocardia acidivorans]